MFVEADADERAGLGAYTPTAYAALLKAELSEAVNGFLGADAVDSGGPNLAFRDELERGARGVEDLCERAGSHRLLLADVNVPSSGFSTLPSAYWPHVTFTAINCNDGRLQKSQGKRLEPQSQDRFECQRDFVGLARAFIASRGYFL